MVKRLFLCLMSVLAFVDALSQTPQAIQVSVTKDDTIYIGEYTNSKLYGDYGGQTISNGKTRPNYELVTLGVNTDNHLIGNEDNSGMKFLLLNNRAAVIVNFH